MCLLPLCYETLLDWCGAVIPKWPMSFITSIFSPPLLPRRREVSELLPCRQCLYILSHLRPQMLLFGSCPVIICGLDCLDSTSKYQPSSAHITHLGCSFLSSIDFHSLGWLCGQLFWSLGRGLQWALWSELCTHHPQHFVSEVPVFQTWYFCPWWAWGSELCAVWFSVLWLLVLRNTITKEQVIEQDERSSSPGGLSSAASDQTAGKINNSWYSSRTQQPVGHELPDPDLCFHQLYHARRAWDNRQLLYQSKRGEKSRFPELLANSNKTRKSHHHCTPVLSIVFFSSFHIDIFWVSGFFLETAI